MNRIMRTSQQAKTVALLAPGLEAKRVCVCVPRRRLVCPMRSKRAKPTRCNSQHGPCFSRLAAMMHVSATTHVKGHTDQKYLHTTDQDNKNTAEGGWIPTSLGLRSSEITGKHIPWERPTGAGRWGTLGARSKATLESSPSLLKVLESMEFR